SIPVNLSPYLISGKSIAKRVADWRHITVAVLPAGTATDTVSCPPGCYFAYILSNGGAASALNQPTLGLPLLSDGGPGTVGQVIQWTYADNYAFAQQSYVLPQTVDAGSATTITLPADRNVSPIWYRTCYYAASSKLLGCGEPMQF